MRNAMFVAALLAWAGGCAEPLIPVGENTDVAVVEVAHVPSRFNPDLDLLFVVDDSEGMQPRQEELARSFERLVARLEFFEYEGRQRLPNLHVGVVSTDMGVGTAHRVAGCDAAGRQGILQGLAGDSTGPTGPARFLRDVLDGGGRDINYQGSLEEALARMVAVGDGGCEIEQPLEAMRVALGGDVLANDGFLRDGAALAVVVVSDEDDCSAASDELYAPGLDSAEPDFRCFTYGSQCNDDVVAEGTYRGCRAREQPRYMHRVADYGLFLDELKGDQVVVTSMAGASADAEIVERSDGALTVASRCEDGREVYPAVRLQSFVSGLAARGFVAPQCGDDAIDAMDAMGRRIRKMLGTRCMDGPVVDIDPDTAGVQPLCDVWMRRPDGSHRAIPACTEPPHVRERNRAPCYYIDEGGCGDYPGTRLELFTWWGRDRDGSWLPQPDGVDVIAECLVDTGHTSQP